MIGQKYIPQFINVDLSPALMGPNLARFVKNLIYTIDDTASANNSKDADAGVFKPIQSTFPYLEDLSLPAGYNQAIGTLTVKKLRWVFVFVYNDQGNHTVYRLNGEDGTYNILDQGPRWNFQLDPINFIHLGGASFETVNITDPDTGLEKVRSFLYTTDFYNDQRFVCVEDIISTHGYDPDLFPYFQGDYDKNLSINMGVPTPKSCISIKEVPRTEADKGLNNQLPFNTWQFRVMAVDVWGRPSEHGIISNTYIPGVNDCIGVNSGIPRCLDLTFDAMTPFIDKIQFEYRNCSDDQWYLSDTLYLYSGSPLGQWWLRERNIDPSFKYNSEDNTITYRFCRDRECQPLPVTETLRVSNPLPRTSMAVAKLAGQIALGNNKDGFNPFSQDLLKKINIVIEPPQNVQDNTANVTIYVPIFNQGLNGENFGRWQAVIKDDAGYIWGDNNPKHGGAKDFGQTFANPQQSGFGGYLVGTSNYVISTQWYLDENNILQEDKDHVGTGKDPEGKPIFQKFVFSNIPKGNYIFRLFSHLVDPATDSNFTATSTTVWGLCPFIGNSFSINTNGRLPRQELLINVCENDYNTLTQDQILVIADLAYFNGSTAKATSGYFYETNKNGYNQYPMELISVSNPVGATSLITDHNGFYWFETRGTNRNFAFKFQSSCVAVQTDISEAHVGMSYYNFYADQLANRIFPNINGLIPVNERSNFSDVPCNRVSIKGRVYLTGTNIPVSNVVVVLTRGQSAITDSNGEYEIIAHDDNLSQPRIDNIVLASSVCAYTGLNGGCIPVLPVIFYKCTTCTIREVKMPDYVLNYLNQRGLLSGGTYGVAVIGWDWLGRPTFAQPIKYITIPSITESKAVSPSKVRVEISPDAIFPPETRYITFAITPETTILTYIDWIVDNVQFIDNSGQVNEIAPTQIKIFYASLLEYSKQNNYNTTATWNFMEAPVGTNAATPFIHDIVNFYLNGDGQYFKNNISALVKYDQAGQYFLIDYTSELADLLPNALIRLSRPKSCTGTEGYFEICEVIDIENGSPKIKSFYLDAFDTYYLYRQIPVPFYVNPSNTAIVSQNVQQVTNPDGSISTTTSTTNQTITQINEPRSFGFPFESDSPSNLWGKGCHNVGRPFVKNPFEAVLYHREQIALSGVISDNGVLNFSNYFDSAKKENFHDTNINGIVGIFPEDSAAVLVLGQDNNFIVGYSDNLVRVNDDGIAIAPSINNKFGNPNTQVGGNYGCRYFDKNTIVKHKGLVHYLDSNECALIQHNYSEAKPFTQSGADSYMRIKIKEIQRYNTTHADKRYFTSVANTINNDYILTDKIIKNSSFVNNLRNFDVTAQETVTFGIFTKMFKQAFGFTPECYAYLEGDVKEKQLFSFVNGVPHGHYNSANNTDYGEIYGQPVNRTITIVAALDNLKKKKYLSAAVYCKEGVYFISNIKTETGQTSRVLISQFLEAEFGFYAPFLCNINTPVNDNNKNINTLFDGDVLNGTWAEITFVGDPSIDTKYSQLQGIVINVIASEKSGV